MLSGVLILGFLGLILAFAVSGISGVTGLLTAGGTAATGAAGSLIRAALPGIPVVYGSCAAAYDVLHLGGPEGWRASLVLIAAVGIAVALGRRTGFAAAIAVLGAMSDAWSDSTESGCIIAGRNLAAYFALAILALTLSVIGTWSANHRHVSWREFAEAVALGAFGVVYLLRYLTYPGSYVHIASPALLDIIAVVAAALVGWLASTAAVVVKAAVAMTVLCLGGTLRLVSIYGNCAEFSLTQWLLPLIAAVPGALLVRFSIVRL